MEETVKPVEVNKGTIIGDVLDLAAACIAWHNILEERTAFLYALLFDEFAAGNDDILAVEIDLNDFKVVGLSNVLIEILRWLYINLRGRHKGIDTDTYDQATLNLRAHTTGDD